jgi:hypothetical protein
MVAWLKKWWPVLILCALAIAILDGTLSTLLTCHPLPATPARAQISQQQKENCTALQGPVLISILWLLKTLHTYEGAVTGVFTIVLAVFTGRLWFSTEKLWQATNTLASDAKSTAQNQAADTRILQRAYVAVAPGGIIPLRYAVPPFTIAHIQVQNVGHLPARNVSWFIDTKLSPDGRLNDFPINEELFFGNNVIRPATGMKRSQNCDFEWDELKTFESANLSLYVWGEIRYTDGFGVSRFTRFCHRYNRAALGYGDHATGGGFVGGVPRLKAEGMPLPPIWERCRLARPTPPAPTRRAPSRHPP